MKRMIKKQLIVFSLFGAFLFLSGAFVQPINASATESVVVDKIQNIKNTYTVLGNTDFQLRENTKLLKDIIQTVIKIGYYLKLFIYKFLESMILTLKALNFIWFFIVCLICICFFYCGGLLWIPFAYTFTLARDDFIDTLHQMLYDLFWG